MEPARMVDLKAVANLCSMEIYREETVLDTVNGKVIFGIWKLQGEILFDVESLPAQIAVAESNYPSEMEEDGTASSAYPDTIRLSLPKEKIELLESTAPDSWRVIDTYSLKLFGNDRMTPEEENQVKKKALLRARRALSKDGTVERARKDAAKTLSDFLTPMVGKPVKVSY